MSAIESARLKMYKNTADLSEPVETVVLLVHEQSEHENITVIIVDFKTPVQFHADELRIRQVLVNLLNNAVKYTPDGGTIQVSYADDGDDFVEIEVKDTGVGMDDAGIEKALRPFERPDSHEQSTEGTGLGLPLSKQLVELHDGEMHIESAVGQGTLIRLRFPAMTP